MHAALPSEPSPYNPSSRVFRNPLYLRVEDVPELAALAPDDRARVEALAVAGRGLLDQDRIDRPAVYRLKDEALRLAHGALDRVPGRRRRADRLHRRHREPGAVRHLLRPPARPRPRLARPGRPPTAIPAGPRWPPSATEHRDEVDYHAWLQWLLDQQLAAVRPASGSSGW